LGYGESRGEPQEARRVVLRGSVGLCRLAFLDATLSHYENRWKTFGLVGSKLIVVVHEDAEHNVHGKAGITIRIISARNATPAEIRPYRNDPL
jgi:uncharacterized DUF497 family protein